ncbi:hypothetical protein FQZ97_1169780 [compost metagenome]
MAQSGGQLVARVHQPARVGGEGVALVGERETVGAAVHQARTAARFQPHQGARHLTHRHVALARHGRERAQLGHAQEQGRVVQIEFHGRIVLVLQKTQSH